MSKDKTDKLFEEFNEIIDSSEGITHLKDLIKIVALTEAEQKGAILETAANSVSQIKLLENQLDEAKQQNEILKDNYNTLKDLYERIKQEAADNRAEAEESRREAKKARKLNIAAFVLSIVLPILSIGASVLIALFL